LSLEIKEHTLYIMIFNIFIIFLTVFVGYLDRLKIVYHIMKNEIPII